MKKFFAMLLSLVMIMSLSVPAFAAEITSTEEGSNSASQNVTANYTPSSTEDTTATITGVSITVDGKTYDSTNTSTENPAIITHNSTVSLTVTGTNLNDATENNYVLYCSDYNLLVSASYGFAVSDGGTTANIDLSSCLNDFKNNTTAFEIKYSNDGGSNWTGSGVYVIYDSGSTEDTTATITGVSITVDGETYNSTNTSADTPAIINSDTTSISLTVTGKNLNKGTEKNCVEFCSGRNTIVAAGYVDNVNDEGTTATLSCSVEEFVSTTTAHEIRYSNDGGDNWIGTGVYVIYDSGIAEADKAVITGVSITVDNVEYTSGNVTITPDTQSIILTVTGTNLQNSTEENKVWYASAYSLYIAERQGWTISDAGSTATADLSSCLSEFEDVTTAFEIKYSNDGEQAWTGSGVYVIYQSETVSVDITWGAMSFTYSDEQVNGADKGWTCEDGANKITVSNSGEVTVDVTVEYTAADDYTEITGEFDVESATLAEDANQVLTLSLDGKPNQALSDATIGSVTVTITKNTVSE